MGKMVPQWDNYQTRKQESTPINIMFGSSFRKKEARQNVFPFRLGNAMALRWSERLGPKRPKTRAAWGVSRLCANSPLTLRKRSRQLRNKSHRSRSICACNAAEVGGSRNQKENPRRNSIAGLRAPAR